MTHLSFSHLSILVVLLTWPCLLVFAQSRIAINVDTPRNSTADSSSAQTQNRIPDLITKDIVIGEKIYRIGIKETHGITEGLHYKFVVRSLSNSTSEFTMLSAENTTYNRELLKVNLANAIYVLWNDKSIQPTGSVTNIIAQYEEAQAIKLLNPIVEKHSTSNPNGDTLTDRELDDIRGAMDLIRSSNAIPDSVATLIDRLTIIFPDSKEFIDTEIAFQNAALRKLNGKSLRIISAQELEETLSRVAIELLDALYKKVWLLNQRGATVGIISIGSEINGRKAPQWLMRSLLKKEKEFSKESQKKANSANRRSSTPVEESAGDEAPNNETQMNEDGSIDNGGGDAWLPGLGADFIISLFENSGQSIYETASNGPGGKPMNALTGSEKYFVVDSVELVFEAGQVRSIQLITHEKITNDRVVFQNRIPIPFSSKSGVGRDSKGGGKRPMRLVTNINRKYSPYYRLYVNFEDLMNYTYLSENYTNNYSPKDTVLWLRPGEAGRILSRPSITEILDVKTFTDLVGLDADNPNGLVQVEFDREIPLNTYTRHGIWLDYNYYTFVNHIKPYFAFTKVEESGRQIVLDKPVIIGQEDTIVQRVTIADYLERQNLTTGLNLNVIKFGFEDVHSVLNLDIGMGLHRTGFQGENREVIDGEERLMDDDPINDFNALAASSLLKLGWTFRPHSRYFLGASYEYRQFHMMNPRLRFSDDTGFFHKSRRLYTAELLAGIRPVQQSVTMLFFRARFNYEAERRNSNFLQVQVGAATSFFSTPRKIDFPGS